MSAPKVWVGSTKVERHALRQTPGTCHPADVGRLPGSLPTEYPVAQVDEHVVLHPGGGVLNVAPDLLSTQAALDEHLLFDGHGLKSRLAADKIAALLHCLNLQSGPYDKFAKALARPFVEKMPAACVKRQSARAGEFGLSICQSGPRAADGSQNTFDGACSVTLSGRAEECVIICSEGASTMDIGRTQLPNFNRALAIGCWQLRHVRVLALVS